MAADSTIRPAHGGYQDAFPEAAMLDIAREIAAQAYDIEDGLQPSMFGPPIRAGENDGDIAVVAALAALKWRFYAQPHFRAAVTQ